jgi:hypothetical protein
MLVNDEISLHFFKSLTGFVYRPEFQSPNL